MSKVQKAWPVEKYDPFKFWERNNHMKNTLQHKLETAQLMAVYDKFVVLDCPQTPTILEVGPGKGRILKAFRASGRAINMTMVDIVDLPRKICRDETGSIPDKWNGRILPYPDASFDLVILFDVLLHVKPAMLLDFWKEQVRVSRKFIFVATGIRHPMPGPPEYTGIIWCFNHDYKKLFSKSVTIIAEKLFKNQKTTKERRDWLLKKVEV